MRDPIPMRLPCPSCGRMHIDKGEFATKPHHTHACQHCGMVWRPAVVETVGVQFLPGFKDDLGEAVIINAADLGLAPGEYLADTSSDGYYLGSLSSDFGGLDV